MQSHHPERQQEYLVAILPDDIYRVEAPDQYSFCFRFLGKKLHNAPDVALLICSVALYLYGQKHFGCDHNQVNLLLRFCSPVV